jgi:thioredoxin reductase (NADPH)
LDSKNFVLTGWDDPSTIRSKSGADRPLLLETSVGGVFAAGDVRSGSVKRVGAAIGEGAIVGAELHIALANGQVGDKSERSASQDALETANALTVPSPQ